MTIIVLSSSARNKFFTKSKAVLSSSDEVGSSNICILASAYKVLAMASLCFCPPLNLDPLSPTCNSNIEFSFRSHLKKMTV